MICSSKLFIAHPIFNEIKISKTKSNVYFLYVNDMIDEINNNKKKQLTWLKDQQNSEEERKINKMV